MPIPAAPSFASFDVTERTEGRAVDSVLWDYMFAKSRLLEVVGTGPRIQQPRFEWVNLGSPTIFVTEANSSSTTVDGTNNGTTLVVLSGEGAKLSAGTLLVNASRGTPIGTHKRNEILRVTDISGNTLTVTRDAGGFNSGSGSTAHALTDKYRVIASPRQEGSSAVDEPNTYVAQTILDNYTAIQSVKLQVTGSQLAREMEVVASDLERQWAREMNQLKNELVSLVLYGFNTNPPGGSDSVIRINKGLLDFMVDNINPVNPLVDYTTTQLTAQAVNALFLKLWENGADPSDGYKIITSGSGQQAISSWEGDKVRTTWTEGRVGRYITTFVSDTGFEAEVIADPMVMKTDLFIINPSKVTIVPFRPFFKTEWGLDTSSANGDDMYYSRVIGEHTLQVVDPGVSHAAMTALAW